MLPDHFLPRNVGIQLTCAPLTGGGASEEVRFLEVGRLEALVGEIERWPSVGVIQLGFRGEPLLHPAYRTCLEVLSRSAVVREALVVQRTDGRLLHGPAAEALLDVPVVTRLQVDLAAPAAGGPDDPPPVPDAEVLSRVQAFAERARARRPDLTLSALLPGGEVVGVDHIARLRPAPEGAGPGPPAGASSRTSLPVLGGCPYAESDALFFTVDGWAHPCPLADHGPLYGSIDSDGLGELLNGPNLCALRHALRLDRRAETPCRDCLVSLAASGDASLRQFWKTRDDEGFVRDAEERRHLFEEVVPSPHRVLRVDLGCGRNKPPGFVGVDRFPLPGVDVVADLDEPLPFPDDSVDLVLASHSLEHIADLMRTLQEVYRVCKHGAQVCVVAPYHQQSLNLANPYHTQAFNEHTPRFWTSDPLPLVDFEEVAHPGAPVWGLSRSDHSDPGIDFRCVRMEFSYFPEYQHLPPAEQRRARHSQLNVCDQVMYHFLVIKGATRPEELQAMARSLEYYEPNYVTLRRLRQQQESLSAALQQAQQALHPQAAELEACRTRAGLLERELEGAKQAWAQVEQLSAAFHARSAELHRTEAALQSATAQANHLRRYQEALEADLLQSRTTLESCSARVLELQAAVEAATAEAQATRDCAVRATRELDLLRYCKAVKLRNRFLDRTDWAGRLPGAFHQLQDDSLLFAGDLTGYRLQPGFNLGRAPYLEYPLTVPRSLLSAILLAPVLDLPFRAGVVSVQVLAAEQGVVAERSVSAPAIRDRVPLRFDFPPIAGVLPPGSRLRVSVRGADAPLRLLEWRCRRLFRLGRLRRKPFSGYLFAPAA